MIPTSPLPDFAIPAHDAPLIARGGARFWRVNFALCLGSFATFAVLYCVQPLMPGFASAFSISPAAASLSLSATTGVLAVAMAYLAEEMDRSAIGLAMGLYIAGTTLGGIGGRLGGAAVADVAGWRAAVAVVGLVSLGAAAVFAFALPRERRISHTTRPIRLLPAVRMHLADPGLRYLFALGFLLMGSLVTTYNYIGFRLAEPPFSLSQSAIGFIFTIYLVGAVSSAVMGELAGRYGRRRVIGVAIVLMPIGILLTLPDSLALTIFGISIFTAGFFGGHSIASSWVGLRAATAKAQASALYLFFYYVGSSLAGFGGWVYAARGWPGVAGFVGALSILALLLAAKLMRVPPPAHLRAT